MQFGDILLDLEGEDHKKYVASMPYRLSLWFPMP